ASPLALWLWPPQAQKRQRQGAVQDAGAPTPSRCGSWPQCAQKVRGDLPMNRCSVAQVANLPYRRLLIGEVLERRTASGLATRDTAQRGQAATNTIQPRMNTDGHG